MSRRVVASIHHRFVHVPSNFPATLFLNSDPVKLFFHSIIYRTVSVYSLDRSAIANRVSSRCEKTLPALCPPSPLISFIFPIISSCKSSYDLLTRSSIILYFEKYRGAD